VPTYAISVTDFGKLVEKSYQAVRSGRSSAPDVPTPCLRQPGAIWGETGDTWRLRRTNSASQIPLDRTTSGHSAVQTLHKQPRWADNRSQSSIVGLWGCEFGSFRKFVLKMFFTLYVCFQVQHCKVML